MHLGGSVVVRVPLSHGVVPGSWDQVHIRLPTGSLLPLLLSLFLSVSNEKKIKDYQQLQKTMLET